MARRTVAKAEEKPAAGASIDEDAAALIASAEALEDAVTRHSNKLPFSTPMDELVMGRGFGKLIETTFAEQLDVESEYSRLEAELEIREALTKPVVQAQLNRVERNAFAASKLLAFAKVTRERYRVDLDVAMGSMRDAARADLEQQKANGERTKQITDADVVAAVASKFPDEWRALSERLAGAEYFVKHLERLSELWQRRSWTLSSLVG